jgi:hypothetical protein
MIRKILFFFTDVLNSRKNIYYINKDSSYHLYRTLYRISNGLLTRLLEILITKKNDKESHFSYKKLENISSEEISNLIKNVREMNIYNRSETKKIHISNMDLNLNKFSFKFDKDYTGNAVRLDVIKTDLLSNKKISEFALQKKWLDIIKDNFKFVPKLIDVTAWYTLPEKNGDEIIEENKSYDAQIWHRDVDKLRDLKIFTYLSDVNDFDDGPFEILNGTHKFSFNKFNYYNKNNFRILNKNIPPKLNNKKISFFGNRGNNFLVNTRCLHRGISVKRNYRLVLELFFSNSFFGKHNKFNYFSKPRLDMKWDSYSLWKEKIEENPEIYKYLFLGRD